jgi:predicted transglutaminase-like cysteine proteinase
MAHLRHTPAEPRIPLCPKWRWPAFAVLLALCGALAFAADLGKMRTALERFRGEGASARFTAWRGLVDELRAQPEAEKLRRVNEFFNGSILFGDDLDVWRQADYWATPLETVGHGAGDCEDFALAKYFTLQELGVPVARMRLTYVRATLGAGGSQTSVAHMVLAYYSSPTAEPLVLDNLIGAIQQAGARPDLRPVFSFNAQGIWTVGSAAPAPVERISRWNDLQLRMRAEGYSF